MLDGFSNVVLGLYRASREQSVGAFQDAAFELIKPVLPFDSALWLTGTLDFGSSDAAFHTHHLYKQPLQLLADWARTKDRAVFSRKVFSSPGVTLNCIISQGFGPELAEHSRRYNIEHILATTNIDPIASLHELISIYRADPDNPFTEEERLFQQNIVPHLAETWRINRMLHLSHASQPTCAVMSRSAAADTKGFLHVVEPGFTRLLHEEWPDWRGPRLPNELVAGIENKSGHFMGKVITVKISDMHDQFLLRGRSKSVVDTLGQRKRDVANYFSEGYTHKEIAKLLDLSPATVRNYLNSIYLKLGIGSKAELATILKEYN